MTPPWLPSACVLSLGWTHRYLNRDEHKISPHNTVSYVSSELSVKLPVLFSLIQKILVDTVESVLHGTKRMKTWE